MLAFSFLHLRSSIFTFSIINSCHFWWLVVLKYNISHHKGISHLTATSTLTVIYENFTLLNWCFLSFFYLLKYSCTSQILQLNWIAVSRKYPSVVPWQLVFYSIVYLSAPAMTLCNQLGCAPHPWLGSAIMARGPHQGDMQESFLQTFSLGPEL